MQKALLSPQKQKKGPDKTKGEIQESVNQAAVRASQSGFGKPNAAVILSKATSQGPGPLADKDSPNPKPNTERPHVESAKQNGAKDNLSKPKSAKVTEKPPSSSNSDARTQKTDSKSSDTSTSEYIRTDELKQKPISARSRRPPESDSEDQVKSKTDTSKNCTIDKPSGKSHTKGSAAELRSSASTQGGLKQVPIKKDCDKPQVQTETTNKTSRQDFVHKKDTKSDNLPKAERAQPSSEAKSSQSTQRAVSAGRNSIKTSTDTGNKTNGGIGGTVHVKESSNAHSNSSISDKSRPCTDTTDKAFSSENIDLKTPKSSKSISTSNKSKPDTQKTAIKSCVKVDKTSKVESLNVIKSDSKETKVDQATADVARPIKSSSAKKTSQGRSDIAKHVKPEKEKQTIAVVREKDAETRQAEKEAARLAAQQRNAQLHLARSPTTLISLDSDNDTSKSKPKTRKKLTSSQSSMKNEQDEVEHLFDPNFESKSFEERNAELKTKALRKLMNQTSQDSNLVNKADKDNYNKVRSKMKAGITRSSPEGGGCEEGREARRALQCDPEVTAWLKQLHLKNTDKYIKLFAEHEIDMDGLRYISEDQLKEIGIRAIGAYNRILMAIKDLQQQHQQQLQEQEEEDSEDVASESEAIPVQSNRTSMLRQNMLEAKQRPQEVHRPWLNPNRIRTVKSKIDTGLAPPGLSRRGEQWRDEGRSEHRKDVRGDSAPSYLGQGRRSNTMADRPFNGRVVKASSLSMLQDEHHHSNNLTQAASVNQLSSKTDLTNYYSKHTDHSGSID